VPPGCFHQVWLNRGSLEFELKSIIAAEPDYLTIHGRIVDAASRAARHSVVKDRFMIDIGDNDLGDLVESLSEFNVGRRKYRLSELWVMSRGRVYQIPLVA